MEPASGKCSGTSLCRCCGHISWSRCCCGRFFEFRAFDNIYVLTWRRTSERDDDVVAVHLFGIVSCGFDLSLGAAASWLMPADVDAAVPVFHVHRPAAGRQLMAALNYVGSRRGKLLFAGGVYAALIALTFAVPVPIAVDHWAVSEDAIAGLRQSSFVRVVATWEN